MIISRLFKITLLAGLFFMGQGAQAMLSTISTLGKFIPNFSTNFALPKEAPNKDPNFGAFVSRSWCRERCKEIKNGSDKTIGELREENTYLKNIFTDEAFRDDILNFKARTQPFNELKKNFSLKNAEVAQLKKERKESEEKFEKERVSLKVELKKAQDSSNNRKSSDKQYSWWKNTKRWMFKKFILASAIIGSIWATNTPTGRKIYDKLIDAKLLKNRIIDAITTRSIDELKDIIEQYRDYKAADNLWQYIDVAEFAQLALTKNANGEDFTEGLELLLQEQIVKIADNGIIVTHTIPNTTTTFKTCKKTCNLLRYVQSAAALKIIIKYGEKLKQEIADYNAKPEHKTKMAPFDIQELLNQVIRNPETGTYETAADIYEKNGNQELIKAAKDAGALTSKAVCEEVIKYLKSDINAIQKLTDSKITTAIIASHRKLLPQKR